MVRLNELKRRSDQIRNETRPGRNTALRIGSLFYDIVSEVEVIYSNLRRKTFVLNYIAIVISLVSIGFSVFKAEKISVMGADLLGWLVGILAILTTVLIGFQIYKAIEIDRIIDKKTAEIEKRVMTNLDEIVEDRIEIILNKKTDANDIATKN